MIKTHGNIQTFIKKVLNEEYVSGKTVLEVGSYDVNGNITDFIQSLHPHTYTKTDMRDGPNVDLVCDITHSVEHLGHEYWDVVICLETLEHVKDWKAAMRNMKMLVKPGGILVLTTRSHGYPQHDYPNDYWRFGVDDMKAIFSDWAVMVAKEPNPQGVFAFAYKPLSYTCDERWAGGMVNWDVLSVEEVIK